MATGNHLKVEVGLDILSNLWCEVSRNAPTRSRIEISLILPISFGLELALAHASFVGSPNEQAVFLKANQSDRPARLSGQGFFPFPRSLPFSEIIINRPSV